MRVCESMEYNTSLLSFVRRFPPGKLVRRVAGNIIERKRYGVRAVLLIRIADWNDRKGGRERESEREREREREREKDRESFRFCLRCNPDEIG